MKFTLSFLLIFALLGSVALSYNDHTYSNVKAKWGKHSATDSDGTLSASAWIEVDVDWFTEPDYRRGVDYSAYADISGSADYGSWNLYVYTPTDSDLKSDSAFHGIAFDQAQASEFDWMSDVTSVYAVDELSRCYGSGSISGSSSGLFYNSATDVWNYGQ